MNESEIRCFVTGCPFAVDPEDREAMEQHVRWIHLRNEDFGEDPLPALTAFVLNGLIRPEEFAETTTAILNRALGAARRRRQVGRAEATVYAVFLLIFALGLAALIALTWRRNSPMESLEALPIVLSIAVGASLTIFGLRGE